MQCLILAGDYVVIVYEPPNINLPNITYAEYEDIPLAADYQVKIEKVGSQSSIPEEFKVLSIESIIERSVNQQI